MENTGNDSNAPRRYDDALAEALAASQRAVEADVLGRTHEALTEYARALALLQHALLEDAQLTSIGENRDEALREQLVQKMQDYQRRIDALSSFAKNDVPSSPKLQSPPTSSESKKGTGPPVGVQGSLPLLSPLDVEYYSKLPVTQVAVKQPLIEESNVTLEPHHPVSTARVGRRGERALEAALRHAAHAHHLDTEFKALQEKENSGSYDEELMARTLRAYLTALDYFAHCAEHAPSGVLASINRTMKSLMVRAEDLKAALLTAGREQSEWTPTHDEKIVPERVLSIWHSQRALERGIDTRFGSLSATMSTPFWNDNRPDAISITLALERNILNLTECTTSSESATTPFRLRVGITLRASVRVNALRVTLVQTRSSCVRVRGPVTRAQRAIVTQVHAHAQRFPLQGPSEFRGALTLLVPNSTEPTESDHSASFALEYEVALSVLVAFHEDLAVRVPLRIVSSPSC